MLHRMFMTAGTVLVLLGAAAAPAVADDGEQTWEMPDIIGMTLQDATDTLRDLTGNPELEIHTDNVRGWKQEQLALTMWDVCWESPEAGETFDEDTWVGAGVVRHGEECWP